MKASEFINTFAFAAVSTDKARGELNDIYQEKFFLIPRIACKDGFSISIQVHNGAYCESENGYRQFGYEWKRVEWGFPSSEIDSDLYNAEDDNTTASVGSCEIDLIDKLIEEHGGLDLIATLKRE